MNLQRFEEKNLKQPENGNSRRPPSAIVRDSFLELFELLEEYAPSWYTEEHHHRAMAALRVLKKS